LAGTNGAPDWLNYRTATSDGWAPRGCFAYDPFLQKHSTTYSGRVFLNSVPGHLVQSFPDGRGCSDKVLVCQKELPTASMTPPAAAAVSYKYYRLVIHTMCAVTTQTAIGELWSYSDAQGTNSVSTTVGSDGSCYPQSSSASYANCSNAFDGLGYTSYHTERSTEQPYEIGFNFNSAQAVGAYSFTGQDCNTKNGHCTTNGSYWSHTHGQPLTWTLLATNDDNRGPARIGSCTSVGCSGTGWTVLATQTENFMMPCESTGTTCSGAYMKYPIFPTMQGSAQGSPCIRWGSDGYPTSASSAVSGRCCQWSPTTCSNPRASQCAQPVAPPTAATCTDR